MAGRIVKRLDEIRALEAAATEGPWKARGLELSTVILDGSNKVLARLGDPLSGYHWNAAAFIAAARTAVPALLGAVDAVLAVHEPVDALMNPGRHERVVQVCTGCGTDDGNWQRFPCPTVSAITTALGGDQ